jgi:hypothetical protein
VSVIQVGGAGKMYRMYDQPQDRLKQMLFARFGRLLGAHTTGIDFRNRQRMRVIDGVRIHTPHYIRRGRRTGKRIAPPSERRTRQRTEAPVSRVPHPARPPGPVASEPKP